MSHTPAKVQVGRALDRTAAERVSRRGGGRARRRAWTLLLAVASVAALLAVSVPSVVGQSQKARIGSTAAKHAPDRVIVGYRKGTGPQRRANIALAAGARNSRPISSRAPRTQVVRLKKGRSVAEAMDEIARQPGVAFVEPDYRLRRAATSNDTFLLSGDLWGLEGGFGSRAKAAWADGWTGSRNVYVGVIDEGVRTDHDDLAANMWTNPFDPPGGGDDDGNSYPNDLHGWDFFNDDASVYDGGSEGTVDRHGTHVAGTIGAVGGNGLGVVGVNWRVTMISAKFLGPDFGYTSDAIRAIDYITDLKTRHGLDIIATNNSWGGGGFSQSLLDAINRGGDAGILFVAAAGNSGSDTDASPHYPSSYECTTPQRSWDCIISVANLHSSGELAGSSNYGATSVDIAAPGSSILSANAAGQGYVRYSGTSMAAPHVAGAVALCRSIDPSLTPKRIRSRVLSTGRSTASAAGNSVTGDRLDVDALADACAADLPDSDPPPPPDPDDPLLIDDRTSGFSRTGGGWREAKRGYDGHMYWTRTRADRKVAKATWRTTLPSAGWYVIRARVPDRNATTRKATYRILTADGWVSRKRSQAANKGSWLKIGTFRLTKTPLVRLTDKTGEARSKGRKVGYDAIRFEKTLAPAATTAAEDETPSPEGDAGAP